MTRKNGARSIIFRFGAAAFVALGLTLAAQTVASAEPAIAVSPSSGLTNGATVTVSGTGLEPGTLYYVGQCAEVSSGVLACDAATSVEVTTNAGGDATTALTVHSSFLGTKSDGSGTTTVDCAVTACLVGANTATGSGPAGTPISFS